MLLVKPVLVQPSMFSRKPRAIGERQSRGWQIRRVRSQLCCSDRELRVISAFGGQQRAITNHAAISADRAPAQTTSLSKPSLVSRCRR